MDIGKDKWTVLEQEVFSLLCKKAGEKLSQREIAKMLKVSPTAASNAVRSLSENNRVIIEKTKTINFVSFKRESKKAIELKRVENLKNIYLSGLSDYLEVELAGATVILFGSFSRGEDTVSSDIDIAVINRKEKSLNLATFEEKLNRKININFYKSWETIHAHLKNNILNGIVLHGSVAL